jgi:SHS2 domain-containing protein
LLGPDADPIGSVHATPLELDAEDPEALLVDFLNELIFLFDARRFLAGDVEVKRITLGRPARVEAVLRGETYDAARHSARTEVKAATFHGMHIERTPRGLEADVVFDL